MSSAAIGSKMRQREHFGPVAVRRPERQALVPARLLTLCVVVANLLQFLQNSALQLAATPNRASAISAFCVSRVHALVRRLASDSYRQSDYYRQCVVLS